MNRVLLLLLPCLLIYSSLQAQDTLPRFSVKNIGSERIIISWVNAYPVTRQITIQRSHDSLINFKSILSVADPAAIQNGFADTKAPTDHMYYRLFVNLDKGQFFFTGSKQPVKDTAKAAVPVETKYIPKGDSAVTTPVAKKPDLFVPSFNVYTNKDGYVFINLPDADQKKYSLKFMEDDGSFLFELKNIREKGLTLDKTNFYHAGWFRFELYDDDKVIERHKFYIGKDF